MKTLAQTFVNEVVAENGGEFFDRFKGKFYLNKKKEFLLSKLIILQL